MHGAIAEKPYDIERTLQAARFLPLVGMTKHAEQLQINFLRKPQNMRKVRLSSVSQQNAYYTSWSAFDLNIIKKQVIR